MTIHELLALTGLTGSDEIPVWDAEASGEPTKKITAQNFAAAIKALASLLGTGDVVNDLTSTATDKPLSANMGKVLNDKFGGVQIVPAYVEITLPDGSNSQTVTIVDLSSFVPSGKSIHAISNIKLGIYVLPYVSNGNVLTYVAEISYDNKLTIVNKSTAWNDYVLRCVLFCV